MKALMRNRSRDLSLFAGKDAVKERERELSVGRVNMGQVIRMRVSVCTERDD